MAEQLKVTEITVRLGTTANTGNFNNIRMDLDATAQVPDGMSFEEAAQALTERVRNALVRQLQAIEDNAPLAAIDALRDIGVPVAPEDEG